jgi:hypothetical protein
MINHDTKLVIDGWKGHVTPRDLFRSFCPEWSSRLTATENKRLASLIEKAEVIGSAELLVGALNAAYEMGRKDATP